MVFRRVYLSVNLINNGLKVLQKFLFPEQTIKILEFFDTEKNECKLKFLPQFNFLPGAFP